MYPNLNKVPALELSSILETVMEGGAAHLAVSNLMLIYTEKEIMAISSLIILSNTEAAPKQRAQIGNCLIQAKPFNEWDLSIDEDRINYNKICWFCGGFGRNPYKEKNKCHECDGSGRSRYGF